VDGALPTRAAKPVVSGRSHDAALGRATRSLVGPGRRGPALPTRTTGKAMARSAVGRIARPRRLVTPARAGGLLGMLATGFLLTLVTGPTAFGLSRVDLPQLAWTDPATVRAALGLADGANVFRIDTRPLEAALRALPAVASAQVSVGLPDAAVTVRIQERTPVLAWQVGSRRYLADASGKVFAEVAASGKLPSGVAVIDDRRIGAGDSLGIGTQLDPVDVDVATRLGSLTPADVGSAATSLRLMVTDEDGFVMTTKGGWSAVFGFYSPETRPTDMIPGQVRLLRSFLADREATVAQVVLASETEGTYIPKATASH